MERAECGVTTLQRCWKNVRRCVICVFGCCSNAKVQEKSETRVFPSDAQSNSESLEGVMENLCITIRFELYKPSVSVTTIQGTLKGKYVQM